MRDYPKVKFCGLKRIKDIRIVNELQPELAGFVFYKKSRRNIDFDTAAQLKAELAPSISAVGVFVDSDIAVVSELLYKGIIDIAQLHGKEDEEYIKALRQRTGKKIIKAFKISSGDDVKNANASCADYVLLDSGTGSGRTFDWSLLYGIKRDYFLAGGLSAENVSEAIDRLSPFALDVSSGIETDGFKDERKMRAFLAKVRGEEN